MHAKYIFRLISGVYKALLLLPLLACGRPTAAPTTDVARPNASGDPSRGWRRKLTIEEAEKESLITDSRLGANPVVFGFINKRWVEFKSNLEPGDELFKFYSPPPAKIGIHGLGGYEIIKNGKVIARLVTET